MESFFHALRESMTQQLRNLELQCNDVIAALRAENDALRAGLLEAQTLPSSPQSATVNRRRASSEKCTGNGLRKIISLDSFDESPQPLLIMTSEQVSLAEATGEIPVDDVRSDIFDSYPTYPTSGVSQCRTESVDLNGSGPMVTLSHHRTESADLGSRPTVRMQLKHDSGSLRSASRKTVLTPADSGDVVSFRAVGWLDGFSFRCITWMLRSKEFDLAISLLILAQTVVLCFEAQYNGWDLGHDLHYRGHNMPASDIWPGAEIIFQLLDWAFGILFAFELLLKVVCFRHQFFYDSQKVVKGVPFGTLKGIQGWNWLDFFVVVAFCIDKIVEYSRINPMMLRLLRLVRLWRLVRLLRYLEAVDHLYVMTTAISSLGKVLAWAVLLLGVMLLTCDLLLVQGLHTTYFNKVTAIDLTDEQLLRHHEIYKHFGTCSRCLLSMFEITLGNWPPLAWLLTEEVSEWFTLVCLLHKLTIGFAVIGVMNGVILQETFSIAHTDDMIMFRQNRRAREVMKEKMTRLFDLLDLSGDGLVELDEFKTIEDNPEMMTWLAALDIETDDLATLFSLIDVKNKDFITLDELVKRMPRIKGTARSIDVLAMRSQNKSLDRRMTNLSS